MWFVRKDEKGDEKNNEEKNLKPWSLVAILETASAILESSLPSLQQQIWWSSGKRSRIYKMRENRYFAVPVRTIYNNCIF